MTLYSYRVTFKPGEIIMLRAALKNMIQYCQEQIDKGETTPFYAHKKSAQAVLDKLYNNVQQISGNSFDPLFDFGEEE